MSTKKPVNKETKAYKEKVIKKLKKKLLKLWSIKVKERAGNRCEVDGCSTGNALNSHHIETFQLHSELRYEIRNGLCLCQSHHKFSSDSAHKSFLFVYRLMLQKHPEDLQYLLNFKPTGEEITAEKLEQKIIEMEAMIFDATPKTKQIGDQELPSTTSSVVEEEIVSPSSTATL